MWWKIRAGAGFRLAQFSCFTRFFFFFFFFFFLRERGRGFSPSSKIRLKQLRQYFPKWCIWCILCSETKPLKRYISKIGNIDLSLNISTNTLQRWFVCCSTDTLSKIICVCLLTFVFIKEIGETVNEEEEFIIHEKVIKSHAPHSRWKMTALKLSVRYFWDHMKRVMSAQRFHGILLRNVMCW